MNNPPVDRELMRLLESIASSIHRQQVNLEAIANSLQQISCWIRPHGLDECKLHGFFPSAEFPFGCPNCADPAQYGTRPSSTDPEPEDPTL